MNNNKKGNNVRKRQLTLFSCSGPVQQKLVDSKNRVHYVPIDAEVILAITTNRNIQNVENQCR